jgi:putative ABC transport system permease protein
MKRAPATARAADRLLRRVLPHDDRGHSIRGDLLEEFEARRDAGRGIRADLWLLRQTAGVAFRYATGALLTAGFLAAIAADARSALRSLRSSPLFALAVIVTLAVSIGLGTVTYGALHAVVLTPLPYDAPEGLFMVVRSGDAHSGASLIEALQQADGVIGMAAYWYPLVPRVLAGDDGGRQLDGIDTSAGMFDVLGARPLLGRGLSASDAVPGAEAVIVISHELWQQQFDADPAVVGADVLIDQQSRRIVGVMPEGFAYPEPPIDYWIPLPLDAETLSRLGDLLTLLVRLDDAADPVEIAAQLEGMVAAARLTDDRDARGAGSPMPNLQIRLVNRRDYVVGELGTTMLVMFAAGGILVAVACANVAALVGVRAGKREREIALRRALGASRWRMVSLFALESGFLTAAGATLGFALALWLSAALPRWLPQVPRIEGAANTQPALVYAVIAGGAVMLVLAVADRRSHTAERRIAHALRGLQRGIAARPRRTFAAVQVAAAVTLLVAAGLLVRSFDALDAIDPGFEAVGVVTFRLSLPREPYVDTGPRVALFRQVNDRLQGLPGVRAASIATHVFSRRDSMGRDLTAETDDGVVSFAAESKGVGLGYFDALSIEVLQGRAFGVEDRPDSRPVAIVSEELARRVWPEGDAVGRRLKTGGPTSPDPWMTVVGVVDDVKTRRLTEAPEPELYLSYEQAIEVRSRRMYVLVAADTSASALDIVPVACRLVHEVDPAVSFTDPALLETLIADTISQPRARARVMSGFAMLAAFLATLGMYSVTMLFVTQRFEEFAIRQALGATRWNLVVRVLRFTFGVAASGAAIGLTAGAVVGRGVESLLYGVVAIDPTTYAAVALWVLATSLLACLPPLVRAALADPAVLLARVE